MFTPDSRAEAFLDYLGVKWRYSNDLDFDDLEDDWDNKRNLGRSQIKIEKAICEFAAMMAAGSAAPAPILCEVGDRLRILDGKHRLLAAESRNETRFSGYIVETDSEAMLNKIQVFANYRLQGGYQESSEWTLEQAIVECYNKDRMSLEEICELGGWKAYQVRDKAQILTFRMAIEGAGGPRMTDKMVGEFAKRAAKEDFEAAPVQIASFANDIEAMKLSADDAAQYVEQFFSVSRGRGKLYDQFVHRLDEFRRDEDVIARKNDPKRMRFQSMTPEGRVMKALKGALTSCRGVLDGREQWRDSMVDYYMIVNQTKTALQKIEKMAKKQNR